LPVERTYREAQEQSVRKVRQLTYVLAYDDLVTPVSRVFSLEGIKRPIVFGRSEKEGEIGFLAPSELRVPDRWASGQHALLERRGDADVLRDNGSRNGTYVNGRVIDEHRLADGDLIEIGHSLFCYRIAESSAVDALSAAGDGARLGKTRTFCPEVTALCADLARLAPSREPILLLAETGSGKEVAAQMIHTLSGRSGAFCPVDCGAIPETLFESTFFGHRRGAFTGATDSRTGEILRADGGTVFLDEVANMSVTAQAKLLRVIEANEVTAVGDTSAQKVDVRWIAATNRDVFANDAAFRSDLLRRLAGYVARIPPLRARREDMGELAAFLLREAGVDKASISAAAGRKLFSSPLPGNVRQLRTVLRSAAILAGDGPIEISHLGVLDADAGDGEGGPGPGPGAGVDDRSSRSPAHGEIEAALEEHGGNVVRAAKQLGTHPRQLYRWIERHAIDLQRYRD
jgi:DNA-binding NtrC family response regulator